MILQIQSSAFLHVATALAKKEFNTITVVLSFHMLSHFILFTESDLEFRFMVASGDQRQNDQSFPPAMLQTDSDENNIVVFNKISMKVLDKESASITLGGRNK